MLPCMLKKALFSDNYAINLVCQHCGFFPVFPATDGCLMQTNQSVGNNIHLVVLYSREIKCAVAQPLGC